MVFIEKNGSVFSATIRVYWINIACNLTVMTPWLAYFKCSDPLIYTGPPSRIQQSDQAMTPPLELDFVDWHDSSPAFLDTTSMRLVVAQSVSQLKDRANH